MDITPAIWAPAGLSIMGIAGTLAVLGAMKKGAETVFGIEIRSKNSRIIYRNRDRLDALEPEVRAIRSQQKTDSDTLAQLREDVSEMHGWMKRGQGR